MTNILYLSEKWNVGEITSHLSWEVCFNIRERCYELKHENYECDVGGWIMKISCLSYMNWVALHEKVLWAHHKSQWKPIKVENLLGSFFIISNEFIKESQSKKFSSLSTWYVENIFSSRSHWLDFKIAFFIHFPLSLIPFTFFTPEWLY